MTNIEKGFIPLPKVEQEQLSDKLMVNLNLPPYVDRDRIGIDLERIHRLCRIGGIGRILLIGNSGQETSHTVPQLVGFNSDGSALASKAVAIVSAPVFDQKVVQNGNRTDSRVVDIMVNANIDEIGLRVADSREGLRSASEWAKQLDGGLKKTVRKVGTSNVIRNRPYLWPDFGAVYSSTATVIFSLGGNINELSFMLNTFAYGMSRLHSKLISEQNSDHRFSFIPGPQIDRAIWLNLVLATGKLIKDMYPDKK